MRTERQKEKTDSILKNMERGLILYLDDSNAVQHSGIPDVYAMRLCQTRVSTLTFYFTGKSKCGHLVGSTTVLAQLF